MPAYQEIPFDRLSNGINNRDKADAVDPAEGIDAMNTTFTEQGAVRQRDGYTTLTESLNNRVASLEPYQESDGTKQLLAGCGTRLEALSVGGSVVSSATGLTDGTWSFARYGGPSAEVAYAGNGKNLLRKWDGSTWSSVANSPQARYLEVQPNDNRLVAAGFDSGSTGPSAATANPSRVWFSDAGAPETWGANNWVDLHPGDGEIVQGVIRWGNGVYVFKETKAFEFFGNSTDSAGNPVFNYNEIPLGGFGLASPRALTAHHTGVYFMARDGVYRTTGNGAELLSDVTSAIWTGSHEDYWRGGTLAHSEITNCAAAFHGEQFYLAFPTTTHNNRVLVYDTRYDWWTIWDVPASCMASFRIGSQPELVFGYSGAMVENRIGRVNSSQTSDAGVAITSRWRGGWFDHGIPQRKTLRQVEAWGSGVVAVKIAVDYELDNRVTGTASMTSTSDLYGDGSGSDLYGDGTSTSDTYGPKGGALRPALVCRSGAQGHVFSVSLENSTLNQGWAVHRFSQHLREIRRPSVVRTS